MKTRIPKEYSGRPLISFLQRELALSSRLITRLKQRENGITVNGLQVTVRYVLNDGDMLEIADEDINSSKNIIPRELFVDVIYEDCDIIAVNKPPHMPTHPSHGHFDDTLANALAYYFKDRPFVFRPINRLDRDTSGVVLAAKSQRASAFLADKMKNGGFKKNYLAVLDGELDGDGIIDSPIRRERESIILRRVCSPDEDGAQSALTEYRLLGVCNGHSLVLASPHTGRTHQLRVHFASIGAPITGDSLYGQVSHLIDRQALHAISLEFISPSGCLNLSAPLPEDMRRLIDSLKLTFEQ